MSIRQVDDCWVIASGEAWLPGNYATKEAARWAFQFEDDVLSVLQQAVNVREGRPITTTDLRDARAKEKR